MTGLPADTPKRRRLADRSVTAKFTAALVASAAVAAGVGAVA